MPRHRVKVLSASEANAQWFERELAQLLDDGWLLRSDVSFVPGETGAHYGRLLATLVLVRVTECDGDGHKSGSA